MTTRDKRAAGMEMCVCVLNTGRDGLSEEQKGKYATQKKRNGQRQEIRKINLKVAK